jgi:hypothetical protein
MLDHCIQGALHNLALAAVCSAAGSAPERSPRMQRKSYTMGTMNAWLVGFGKLRPVWLLVSGTEDPPHHSEKSVEAESVPPR